MVTSTVNRILLDFCHRRRYIHHMVDEPDSLVLRSLRRIETGMDGLREDNREIKTRLGLLEQQVGVMGQQVATVSVRMDRVELRLDRIERRLDLVEA